MDILRIKHAIRNKNALELVLNTQLVDKDTLNIQHKELGNHTLIAYAVIMSDVFAVHHLLDIGADPRYGETHGVSSFHLAVNNGNVAIVSSLVRSGADVNALDRQGHSSFHLATFRNNIDMMMLLANSGACVDEPDTEGCTPLYYAICSGDEKTVRCILSEGIDISRMFHTPVGALSYLHLALKYAYKEKVGILTALLEHGADTSIVYPYGKTPLEYVNVHCSIEVVRLLTRYATPNNKEVYQPF